MSATAVASLDERRREQLMDEIAQLLKAGRAAQWSAGDKLCEAVKGLPRAERARVFREAAVGAHSTVAYIRVIWQLSHYFAAPHRYEHVAQALYRACIAAARRTKQDPVAVLQTALDRGWHVSEVSALGRAAKTTRTLETRCPDCDAEVRVTMQGEATFPPIPCPVCCAIAWADGGDGREAARLGTLGGEA